MAELYVEKIYLRGEPTPVIRFGLEPGIGGAKSLDEVAEYAKTQYVDTFKGAAGGKDIPIKPISNMQGQELEIVRRISGKIETVVKQGLSESELHYLALKMTEE